jgi:large subunit ribosomal protein L9
VELVLTKDVPNVGIANEVVTVKDGFARNYLLPQKMAVVATPSILKERANKIERAKERKQKCISEAMELAERINKLRVNFLRKTSEEGRLFGSVTKEEIADALKADHLIEVDKRMIVVPNNHIKEIGETVVKVKLETGIVGLLTVEVKSENIPEKVEEAPVVAEEVVEETTEEEAAE